MKGVFVICVLMLVILRQFHDHIALLKYLGYIHIYSKHVFVMVFNLYLQIK